MGRIEGTDREQIQLISYERQIRGRFYDYISY